MILYKTSACKKMKGCLFFLLFPRSPIYCMDYSFHADYFKVTACYLYSWH